MNIVILSKSAAIYSTYSLLRAADRRGHFVRVIDYMDCDIGIRDNRPILYVDGDELEDVDYFIPRIASSYTVHGADLLRQIEWMGVQSTVTSDALVQARDKISSLQILGKAGIAVPNMVTVANQRYYDVLIDKIEEYPKILKLANGTQGLGVVKSDNKANMESIVESFSKLNQRLLIQEFIGESKGEDVRIIVVGDKIVASMVRQAREGEFRSNLHRGGTSFNAILSNEEKAIAISSVKALGLEVAGVDILRSSKGPLVIEVNASPGLEGIETTTNVDVANQIIWYCEEQFQKNKMASHIA